MWLKYLNLSCENYLLTPWCRVLLEKLTGLRLVKKFPAFHGTRRFITALTSICHLSLFWANPIQSIYPHPTSWRSILILSTHLLLGLPSGLLPYVMKIRYIFLRRISYCVLYKYQLENKCSFIKISCLYANSQVISALGYLPTI